MSILTIMWKNPYCTATTLSSFNQLNLNFSLLLCLIFNLMIALFIVCLLGVLELFRSSVNLCLGRVKKEPVFAESQKSLSLLLNG